jgi:hypothetical protein
VAAILGHYHHREGQIYDACVGAYGLDVDNCVFRCHIEQFGDEAQRCVGGDFEVLSSKGGALDPGKGRAPSGCEIVPLGYLCVGGAGGVPDGNSVYFIEFVPK